MNTTALAIVRLLAARHSKDVFVPECKDGPTQGARHRRVDALAMAKSWARPCITAYEIKVSRSDFLQDEKWSDYLPMCNRLFFVCPYGLIDPAEIPPDVGLLWTSKNATRVYIKRKAPHREVDPVAILPMFTYILMCRAQITNEWQPATRAGRIERWQQWAEDREAAAALGALVSRKIQDHVGAVRDENERLKNENEALADLHHRLVELGHDPANAVSTWTVRAALAKLEEVFPKDLERQLNHAHQRLGDVLDKIETIKTQ